MRQEQKIRNYLYDLLGTDSKLIPESIIIFWSEEYGKQVDMILQDKRGIEWRIDRVLTVDVESDVDHNKISWRNNSAAEELDYSVPYLESVLPNWEENELLIPILGIDSNSMANYDLVVINLTDIKLFKLSVWVHDENVGNEEPVLHDFEDDFETFFIKWHQL
jgi:hypothetical protein